VGGLETDLVREGAHPESETPAFRASCEMSFVDFDADFGRLTIKQRRNRLPNGDA